MKKNMQWIKTKLIAHRGLHDIEKAIPENSMLSFKNAIESNYGIECDIRISKDDLLYAFHDKNTKRLCGTDKKFESLSSNEITKLRLLGTNEVVPLFNDLLTLVESKVPLMIEIKPTRRYKKLLNILMKELDKYKGEFLIQSYSPVIVIHLKRKYPSVIRGIITEDYGHSYQPPYPIWILSKLPILDKLMKPDFYNYNIKDLPNKKMDRLKAQGIPVVSFTARSKEQLEFVKEKYDNAVFEKFIP